LGTQFQNIPDLQRKPIDQDPLRHNAGQPIFPGQCGGEWNLRDQLHISDQRISRINAFHLGQTTLDRPITLNHGH